MHLPRLLQPSDIMHWGVVWCDQHGFTAEEEKPPPSQDMIDEAVHENVHLSQASTWLVYGIAYTKMSIYLWPVPDWCTISPTRECQSIAGQYMAGVQYRLQENVCLSLSSTLLAYSIANTRMSISGQYMAGVRYRLHENVHLSLTSALLAYSIAFHRLGEEDMGKQLGKQRQVHHTTHTDYRGGA